MIVKARMLVKNPERYYVCHSCKAWVPILEKHPKFYPIEKEFKKAHYNHPISIVSEEQFKSILGLSEWR